MLLCVLLPGWEGAAAAGSGEVLLLFPPLSSARGSESALGGCRAACADQL